MFYMWIYVVNYFLILHLTKLCNPDGVRLISCLTEYIVLIAYFYKSLIGIIIVIRV